MIRVVSTLLAGLLLLSFSSLPAEAKSKTVKLKVPMRIAWVLEEEIDEEEQLPVRAPGLWADALKPLNFLYLDKADNNSVTSRCDVETLIGGNICKSISSADADFVIGGRIEAEVQKVGGAGPKVGLKLNIKLKVYRVDDGKMLAKIRQFPYASADSKAAAFANAVKKVALPISMQLSNILSAYLKQRAEGTLKITGFSTQEEREDPLTSLRFIEGVNSLIMVESLPDYSVYRIGFSGVTWGGLIRQVNLTQGAGVEARITGNYEATGVYKADRAFRLLTAVTELKAGPATGLLPKKKEVLVQLIEQDIRRLHYFMPVVFPVRLPHIASKARKEMSLQYGGDLVLLPNVILESSGDTMVLIEVWSTFAGKLFSVLQTVEAGNYERAIKAAVYKIGQKMPPMLKRRRGKMKKLKRIQFDAWKKGQML